MFWDSADADRTCQPQRPGPKPNRNIASAHVATFGERVVDVFYVTDLLGAKITTATRQAAIKRALTTLFGDSEQPAPKQPAAVG